MGGGKDQRGGDNTVKRVKEQEDAFGRSGGTREIKGQEHFFIATCKRRLREKKGGGPEGEGKKGGRGRRRIMRKGGKENHY